MKILICVRPSGDYVIASNNGVSFDSEVDAFQAAVAQHRAKPDLANFYRVFRVVDSDDPSACFEITFPFQEPKQKGGLL